MSCFQRVSDGQFCSQMKFELHPLKVWVWQNTLSELYGLQSGIQSGFPRGDRTMQNEIKSWDAPHVTGSAGTFWNVSTT